MLISCLIAYKKFYPIYVANEVIITYGLHPFDICSQNPLLWKYIKITFIFTYIFSNLIFSNLFCNIIYKLFFKNKKIKKEDYIENNLINENKSNIKKHYSSKINKKKMTVKESNNSNLSTQNNHNKLDLLIGKFENKDVFVSEKGLYQNFLITGTIGSGKSSSAMYPFNRQLLQYNSENPKDKIGMLILDVKGNYYKQIYNYVNKFELKKDLVVIGLNSGIFYNPLHKPNLKPIVIANRLKTILTLFSENNTESYWLDKAEQVIASAITLCRLYNNNYVTFSEIHKIITVPNYYQEKIGVLRNLFLASKLSNKQVYELNECLNFFQKEFEALDPRTKGILVSEITRITNTFISDYDVFKTFSPDKNQLNFLGFKDVIKSGKIVVLNMNIAEYDMLSKIIAAYLKLDFQAEIISNLSKSNGNIRKTAFICDEYDKYCTKTDSEFFSLSREAKCINIVSTQSYSSLKNTLKDETAVKVLTQNLINKIWFRTDDMFTIEEAQKQLGKEDKKRISKTISESAKETNFNYITNSLNSQNSNISESYNSYFQNEYIYDTNFFTRNLETFTALTFLSDGSKIFNPQKLQMIPYFKNE